MKNTYLKRFMPLTWEANDKKITIAFIAEIFNNQTLVHFADRKGPGQALCIFKIVEDPEVERGKLHLSKHIHNLVMDKRWDETDHAPHITTLVILHNPGADHDSMTTGDAPTIPI